MAKKDSVKICLNDSCPIDIDMDLVTCTESCSNHSSCYLFKHKNVGPVGKCFLYGFNSNQGMPSDEMCENALGTNCCQKGFIRENRVLLYIRTHNIVL